MEAKTYSSPRKNYRAVGAILVILVLALGFIFLRLYPQQNINTLQEIKVDHETGGLIPNFPSFPMYPGASIKTSQHVQGMKSYQVYLTTPNTVKSVLDWYKFELQKNGWHLDRDVDSTTPTDQNIVVSNKSSKATVNAEREYNKTSISVHVETI